MSRPPDVQHRPLKTQPMANMDAASLAHVQFSPWLDKPMKSQAHGQLSTWPN